MSKAKDLLGLIEGNKVYAEFKDGTGTTTYTIEQSPRTKDRLLVLPFFAVRYDWKKIVKEFEKISPDFHPYASEGEDLFTIDIPKGMNRSKVVSTIKSIVSKF